jgi:hypothetical protein
MDQFLTWLRDLPPFVAAVVVAAIPLAGVALGFLAARRLNAAKLDETKETTFNLVLESRDALAHQLRAVEKEIPGWKAKIAVAEAGYARCKHECKNASDIHHHAQHVIDLIGRMSYYKAPGEPETEVERRFNEIKAAAEHITQLRVEPETAETKS